MSSSLVVYNQTISISDLYREAFTEDEVIRLVNMKDRYPYIEFTDSNLQFCHLMFVKWRFTNGDLARKDGHVTTSLRELRYGKGNLARS